MPTSPDEDTGQSARDVAAAACTLQNDVIEAVPP